MLCQSIPPTTAHLKDSLTSNKPRFSTKRDTSKRHTIASYSDHDFHGIFKESGLPFIQQNHKKKSMLDHFSSVPEHFHQRQTDSLVGWYLNQPLNSFLPEFRQVRLNEDEQEEERFLVEKQLLQHWKTIENYYVKRLASLQKDIDSATLQNEKLFVAKEELVQQVLQLHHKSMELSAKNEALVKTIADHENSIHATMYQGSGSNNTCDRAHPSCFVGGVTLTDPPSNQQQPNPPFSPTPPNPQQTNSADIAPPPAISISEPLSLSNNTAFADTTAKPVKKESSPGLFRQISLRLSTRRKRSVLQHETADNGFHNNVMSSNHLQPNNSSTLHSGTSSSMSAEKHNHHHLSVLQQRQSSRNTKSAAEQQQPLLHPAAVLSTSPPSNQHITSSNSYFQQKQQAPRPQDPAGANSTTNNTTTAAATATATAATDNNGNNRYKSLFGNDLVQQAKAENTLVPHIVSRCISEVECRGLDVEGIYRKSGTYAQVKELQNEFSQEDPQLSKYDDVNVITSLLKLYFRELATPLIPSHFILPSSLTDQERLNKTYALLHQLPLEIYSTIKHLVQHLKRVHQNEAKNRMNSRNLAVVFGPTLMKCSNGDQQMHDIINTVDFIIQQSHVLFADY